MEQAENNLILIAGDSAVSKYTLTYCESPLLCLQNQKTEWTSNTQNILLNHLTDILQL